MLQVILIEEQLGIISDKMFTLCTSYCTASVCLAHYNIVMLAVNGPITKPEAPWSNTEKSCTSDTEVSPFHCFQHLTLKLSLSYSWLTAIHCDLSAAKANSGACSLDNGC